MRLRECVEDKLGEWQCGFRPSRSTSDLIFCMKMIIEKTWEFDNKCYIALLDLEKAFDRVPRQHLWKIMQKVEYDIPPKLWKAIVGMYRDCKSCVRSHTGTGPWFDVKTGVRQGSALSPLLFILLMDQVLKQSTLGTQMEGLTFAFADDVGIAARSPEELQQSLNTWCKVLAANGLRLNEAKSEIMQVARIPTVGVHLYANGSELKVVEKIKYLGVAFDCTAANDTAVRDRINQFTRNVGFLYPLLKDRYVPRASKVSIYKTILRPVLTYGCENWTLTAYLKNTLQAAEMRVLRLIKGVTIRDKLRSEDIRAELGVKGVLQFVEESQLRWFGHIKRMADERLPLQLLQWRPDSVRPRGRPRKRWTDNIKEAAINRGTTLKNIERSRLYLDRGTWRGFVQTDCKV